MLKPDSNIILFRIDDVAEINSEFIDLIDLLEAKKIICILGVIPLKVSKEMASYLSTLKYAKVFQHGYTHISPLNTIKNEFPSSLPYELIKRNLSKGSEILESITGIKPNGYIPPWNKLSLLAEKALFELGFLYISSNPASKGLTKLLHIGYDFDPVVSYSPYLEMTPSLIMLKLNDNQIRGSVVTLVLHLKHMSSNLYNFIINLLTEDKVKAITWEEIIRFYKTNKVNERYTE
jgi:hypothetical protein